jgi:cyclic pyranopterin phosphate synthase
VSLSHLDAEGRARMVDVGAKPVTERSATAAGQVRMSKVAYELLQEGKAAKGDVLTVAEVAGVMAAKKTGELIPLCHPLGLDLARVECTLEPALPGVRVLATCRTTGRTGVEMEALTAVSIACLTIYDMVKAADRGMRIEAVRLLAKSGGSSGDWHSDDADSTPHRTKEGR